MKALKNFSRFITIVIGCALIWGIMNYDKPEETKKVDTSKKEIKKSEVNVANIERQYTEIVNDLQKQNNLLLEQLQASMENIDHLTAQVKRTENKIVRLSIKDTSGVSISDQLSDCDTLKKQVLVYTVQVDSMQNEYNAHIKILNESVSIKDSAIASIDTAFTILKNEADKNLQREKQLTDDLNKALKKQRRSALKNKILSGGLIVITAVTTALYLKGK